MLTQRSRPTTPIVPAHRIPGHRLYVVPPPARRKYGRDWLLLNSKRIVSTNEVLNAVSEYFDESISAMRSSARTRPTTHARQVAMFLLRENTYKPWSYIGRALSKDYTSALHGHRKIANLILTDDDTAQDISEIRRRLGAI